MEKDRDDEIFERELSQKNHKELISQIKNLSEAILNRKEAGIEDGLKIYLQKIDHALNALNNKNESSPKINVNLEEAVRAIDRIKAEIVDSNNAFMRYMESRLVPDKISFVRNYRGVADSVQITYKSIKELRDGR